MSEWAAKRFWTEVSVEPVDGGFAVHLDGRPVKTPAKTLLVLPNRRVADAVAEEWRAVEGAINPEVMPFTRAANSAHDKVTPQFDEVAAMLAAYGESDLLCYRAESPEALVARQAAQWDPLLDWASDTYDARLQITTGVMPVEQSPQAVKNLAAPLYAADAFELTALHDLVALSGSLVLALAVTQRRLTAAEAWDLSRVDEDWQIEQWGEDETAAQMAEVKQRAFHHAAALHGMIAD
ncbi:ATP12 family chaperone protein [Thalassorhabdomicrobium marinisediminis]|uniref:ATPase n=1 Tax=Thalassorhabdomicrobium marinisediminis TaxID=2170577 RepID=A0A2T7FWC0_9RHOB|nr:ATP12 family protein [Thalassorhabdomicrobium marinisediminis]PVA06457.1 ATPase [Thalassorhabdomicrobium marinisediminis]